MDRFSYDGKNIYLSFKVCYQPILILIKLVCKNYCSLKCYAVIKINHCNFDLLLITSQNIFDGENETRIWQDLFDNYILQLGGLLEWVGICCVFRPANGCSACRSLIEIIFLTLKQLFTSFLVMKLGGGNYFHFIKFPLKNTIYILHSPIVYRLFIWDLQP